MTTTGFFRTALDAFIAGRQRQADHQVRRFIEGLSDETLRYYGYDCPDLRKVSNRF